MNALEDKLTEEHKTIGYKIKRFAHYVEYSIYGIIWVSCIYGIGDIFHKRFEGPKWEEREITVGKTNANYAVVLSGLEVGELVALRDPTIPLAEFGTEYKVPPQKIQRTQQSTEPSLSPGLGRGGMGGGPSPQRDQLP